MWWFKLRLDKQIKGRQVYISITFQRQSIPLDEMIEIGPGEHIPSSQNKLQTHARKQSQQSDNSATGNRRPATGSQDPAAGSSEQQSSSERMNRGGGGWVESRRQYIYTYTAP